MKYEPLTSVRNPLVQMLRSLKDKKGRDETGMLLVEGEKLLREALACALTPGFLLFEADKRPPDALVDAFFEAGAEIHPVSESVMRSVSDTRTPQGCCAAFRLPAPMAGYPDRLVALDGVQDPGNVGTIWRTADAAGFQGLLLGADCADPYSPKVQRAAMGSGLRLPCAQAALAEALATLRGRGYAVIASTLDGAPFYARAGVGDRYVLVVGGEARGVGDAALEQATMRLRLPMRGGAESLNAAVAAGIMMYELTRELNDERDKR